MIRWLRSLFRWRLVRYPTESPGVFAWRWQRAAWPRPSWYETDEQYHERREAREWE